MGFLIISLLTLAGLGAIFLAAFIKLWHTPPSIRIIVDSPPEVKFVIQQMPAKIETDSPVDIPIPYEILAYIAEESEVHAQESRKRRARALYADAQDWGIVKRMLELEDNALESV